MLQIQKCKRVCLLGKAAHAYLQYKLVFTVISKLPQGILMKIFLWSFCLIGYFVLTEMHEGKKKCKKTPQKNRLPCILIALIPFARIQCAHIRTTNVAGGSISACAHAEERSPDMLSLVCIARITGQHCCQVAENVCINIIVCCVAAPI